MSDKEPYDREAHDILFYNVLGLITCKRENKLTEAQQARLSSYNFTYEEMNLLEAYDKAYSSFLRACMILREEERKMQLRGKPDKYYNSIVTNSKALILNCKNTLANLETREEMQSILNRFSKPNEDIQLTFANEYSARIKTEPIYLQRQQAEKRDKYLINTAIAIGIFLVIFIFSAYLSPYI